MNLYLVRHADYVDESIDSRRPISESGREDILRVGKYAAENFRMDIKSISHSGKTRARQTAEYLRSCLNHPIETIEVSGLMPTDDPGDWRIRVQNEEEDIMLVGHLPFIADLTMWLLRDSGDTRLVNFATSQILCLERNDEGLWLYKWLVNPSTC